MATVDDSFMKEQDEAVRDAVALAPSRAPSTWLVLNLTAPGEFVVEGRTEADAKQALLDLDMPASTYHLWPLRNAVKDPVVVGVEEVTTKVVR